MSHIPPLTPEEIHDPELQALIQRCEELGVPDALFPRILARVPAHAKALLRALLVSHAEGSVDHRLKEVIRVQLARNAGDTYFAMELGAFVAFHYGMQAFMRTLGASICAARTTNPQTENDSSRR